MKKVFNWFWLVFYSILPIYFIVLLLVSAFGYYKLTELVEYQWWLFFFAFEIWFNSVGSKRIEECWIKIKGE
jgi:hypothetical protein